MNDKEILIEHTEIFVFEFSDFDISYEKKYNIWLATNHDIDTYPEDFIIELKDEVFLEEEVLLWNYFLFTKEDLNNLKDKVREYKKIKQEEK